MRLRHLNKLLLTGAAALSLAACGGGGGGERVASIPTPPVTPTPTPSSSPIPPAHIGLVSPAPFAVLAMGDSFTRDASGHSSPTSGPSAEIVQFSYDAASNTYQISLPDFQSGSLANIAYNGSAGQVAGSSTSQITAGSSSTLQPVFVTLPVPGSSYSPYTYTSFGEWNGQTGVDSAGQSIRSEGIFAYGIPTAPGGVPTTGSASYTAQIVATLGPNTYPPNGVGGDVSLLFNLAAGTLSGSMHPQIIDGFDGIFVDFGRFDFKNTIYSTGSTTFSGQFVVPGLPNASSSFNGNFTGPGAAELMAQFQTPYLLSGEQGTISGIWVGKKN
jgi:hypothetical protein